MSYQLPTDNGAYNYGGPNSAEPSMHNQSIGRTERSGGVVEPSELDLDLFNRLLKTSVIKASPAIKTIHERKIVVLDQLNSQKLLNGTIFANYLLVLKDVMSKLNQDFAIEDSLASQLKDQMTPQARLYNWNLLCSQLDKIGIIIENDVKSLYVAGDNEEISALFMRIEKYIKRISGDPDVLNFKDYRRDDRKKDAGSGVKQNMANLDGGMQGRRGLQTTQKRAVKDGVDIMSMDIGKDPSETESTLEFILNTLCRALTMKPKQAAALLTNNNQFLTHCVVKGVKGQFEPMINWYNDIYQNSRHLSMMLETEVDNAVSSKDPKQMKASSQNFEKVMQTISTGCYSQNFQVAQLCIKTLIALAQDLNANIEMLQLQMKWFLSKENGLYTINYAYKKHQELTEEFVMAIGNFTNSGEQMNAIYLQELNNLYPDMVDYFNALNQMWPFLQMNYQKELIQAHQNPEDYLLGLLIAKAAKYSESSMQNTPQVRISALSLLTEIWLSHSSFIDLQNQHKNQLESIYQRSSRDRMRSVRIVAVTQMFKLLDKFSQEKNMSAPTLYKQLIFSLIESPQDQTVRELYLTNFSYLFENMKSIPVGLLVDPFVKANQAGDSFVFQTFDYDFFAFMAQHPKLTPTNAIQMLDLLARQYLNDICNASAVSVPFMMICSRFISVVQCQEFIMKFITISLNQLLQISSSKQDLLDGAKSSSSQKSKPLALPAPPAGDSRLRNQRGSQLRGSAANKDFRISTGKKTSNKQQLANQLQKSEDEVNKRLKKSQIITMLLKIQNLRQDDVNNAMRDMLLGAQKQYKDQNYGYVHNGIMAVLKYWGDPDLMFSQYLKRQEKIEAEERKAYERLQRMEQVERRMLGYESDDKASAGGRAPGSLGLSKNKGLKGSGRNSMALMPIAENQQNLRALHELEMIKKYKKDKELEEKRKLEAELRLQNKKDARLMEELERRKVEVGVPANKGGVRQELRALIYKNEDGSDARKKNKNALIDSIQLVDLNEEEDRDREIINQYMKKYLKIWKYLFSRYANQMYSARGKKDFDDLGLRQQQINLPEAIKMLKDHDTYPQLINKNEMQTLFRLMNINSKGIDQSSITMLDYNQFLEFVPQLALFCFSRPPVDKSQYPPIESLMALIARFEQATRDRGKSTLIYEDPDASVFADRELLQALDKKVNEDPSYPIPEGYRKVQSKNPIYKYQVSEAIKPLMSEQQIIATEVMDDILFQALGVHFLEPLVHFEIEYKVKPAITKTKKPQAEALGYMKKVEKKVDEEKLKGTPVAKMSAQEKRQKDLEIVPKINLALKLQVTKQDLKNRPHYQEVAEVLEEMLQAVAKGQKFMPPRAHRKPGQLPNEIKAQREAEAMMAKEMEMQADMKRHERDTKLKKKLKDSAFGGRQMPLDDYKKIKSKVEQEEIEKLEKKKRDEFQEKQKKEKEKLAMKKAQQLEELQKQRADEMKQEELRKKEEKEKNKQFLEKQKQKIQDDFQQTYNKRDTILAKRDQQLKVQKDNELRLKKEMKEYIESSKQDREIEKLERKDIEQFIQGDTVAQVFDKYQKQLYHMFKFYAQQDGNKDKLAHDSEYLMNTLSYKEFVRWSYQQDITPNLVTPEDMVYIYKTLVREQEDLFLDQQKAPLDATNTNLQQTQADKNGTMKGQAQAPSPADKNATAKGQTLTGGNATMKAQLTADQRNKTGMLDYDLFKKAICRISIRSQEKLGGGNKDILQQKLQEETKNREEKMKEKGKFLNYQSIKDEKEKEKMDLLKQQFQMEQQYKEEQRNKRVSELKEEWQTTKQQKPGDAQPKQSQNQQKPGQKPPPQKAQEKPPKENLQSTVSKNRLKYELDKKYQMDQAKLQQEEEFFSKWLKQRENLGIDDAPDLTTGRKTTKEADLKLKQKKDLTQNELEQLNKQIKEQKRLKNVQIQKGAVREKQDVNIISANTIEAFMRYLQLDADTTERDLDRRLTQVNTVGRKTVVREPLEEVPDYLAERRLEAQQQQQQQQQPPKQAPKQQQKPKK